MRATTLLRSIIAVLAAVAGLSGCAAVPSARAAAPPRTATVLPCTDLPILPTALCGSIVVPLDRTDPGAGGTTVRFALAPRTDQAHPALGTVAVNPGGPGPSAVDQSGEAFAGALAPVLDRRDLLLVDSGT